MAAQSLPYELAIRCGRPNRRSPDKPCGFRLCMGVLCETVTHEPGFPFTYYVRFARSRVIDRAVDHEVKNRVSSSATDDVAHEFPCPKCGAVPRLNPFRLVPAWLAAARAGNRSLYVT